MKSVPKIYKAGARQLFDKIKEHQDVLLWNDKGVIDFIRNQYISTVTGFYSDTLAKNDRVPQR